MRTGKLKSTIMWLLLIACVPLTIWYPQIFGRRRYYMASFVFALLTIGAVFTTFENQHTDALKLSLIAVMCALGIAGRAVFAGVPYVKPVAAVVILTGVSFGPRAGFMSGAMIMLISNFMFSQGPWTVWQMLAFGVLGFASGLIFYRRKKIQKPVILSVFGFSIYVGIIGPILDLSGIFAYSMGGKASLRATMRAGLPVNLTAGTATAVFLMLISAPMLKKINRIVRKYNL